MLGSRFLIASSAIRISVGDEQSIIKHHNGIELRSGAFDRGFQLTEIPHVDVFECDTDLLRRLS
jgi:hypothetical protein